MTKKPGRTRFLKTLAFASTLLLSLTAQGCADKHEHCCREGRHVRVRAPFTRVDVFIPDDDAEDTDVRVDVND